MKRPLLGPSARSLLHLAPTALYVSALAGTIVFAFTQVVLAWQTAIYAGLAGLVVGIASSWLDGRDLDGTAEWDPTRTATLNCTVFGLGAVTLAAMNVCVQRSAYGIELPVPAGVQIKPDVLVALMTLAGTVGFSIAANVVGRGLARSRAIQLRVDAPTPAPIAFVPLPLRRRS